MKKSLEDQVANLSRQHEEMDMFISELMFESAGSFFPALVVAASLIDCGVIKLNRLLSITDAVLDIAATQVPAVGEDESYLQPLESFRAFLEQTALGEGSSVERLQLQAALASAFQEMRSKGTRSRRDDGKAADGA